MYAVEFETVVDNNCIHIPGKFREFDSQKVKVILMMTPEKRMRGKRKPGTAKGKIIVSDDFEQPLNEEEKNKISMELERQKLNISFDEEINHELDENSLDLKRLEADFREYTGKKLTSNDFFNLKILKNEHNKTHPTIGGLLLAGASGYLEYARIKCARFKGDNMDEMIDQKEFSGPLYRQVEEAMKFAHVYIAKSGKVVGLRRIDRCEVPLEVIREALVNAIVHRDYSISGSDIKFAIFDDRIEITSPGTLPMSLEIDDIVAGRSEIRNKVIARFFKEIEFIEQWGNGIGKMIRLLVEHGLKEPEFRESGRFFKVTIYKTADEKKAPRYRKKNSAKVTPEHTRYYSNSSARTGGF
jgi:ATP-dependent DNA helicase RecG